MNPPSELRKKNWYQINPAVFFGSAIFIFIFVAIGLLAPDTFQTVTNQVKTWITLSAGWFYILAVAGFLIFVIAIAMSSYGKLKLGPDHSRPDYSYSSWFAMLFTAGMGIGLMFFGVAEPVMHLANPPVGDPNTIEAARQAMRITFFHWGLHAWAIYAVVALSLAYFAYRHKLPLLIRSSLYPLIGKRIYGPIGHAVDIFAVLGTIFGIATSLGLGVTQVNAGLNYLFGLPQTTTIQIILIIVICIIASMSVAAGLDKGVKRLSELNMFLAVSLMVFVLIAGPTIFLLQTLVQNTGMYFSNLFSMTFNLYAYQETDWIGGWTLFYWGWWIAWSPFVGMFIARVSRGRTIREFIAGMLCVPIGFTFMWMTFFGDAAIYLILKENALSLITEVQADQAVALFKFFEYLPFSSISSFIATLLIIMFFVTSADSGSLVVDLLTSGKEGSPAWQRVFWVAVQGIIASVLLLSGGLLALQSATIASALPFAIIMILMCWGLLRAMRLDLTKKNSIQDAHITPRANGIRPRSWQDRLQLVMHRPNRLQDVNTFMHNTVKPALQAIADEFKKQSIDAQVIEKDAGHIWLQVGHQEEVDFYYSVHVRQYHPPAFMTEAQEKVIPSLYYRAEVHLQEGGQDYDIMDWTIEDITQDLIDQYERHLHFLSVVR